MSYAIGLKIKVLRCNLNISQEKMAEVLGTTRQRYSRLENGQVDISYIVIKKIADFFGIPTKEITNSQEEKKELVTLFRERTDSTEAIKFVAKIEEILKVFHAHEKLYYQMKVCDDADD